ncbi:TonB-dependent receptor [Aggregatibacter actinomycetemcomitans]|nr:TonB-dependent receptor [Aggregatibacter actinomycetemcomitans]
MKKVLLATLLSAFAMSASAASATCEKYYAELDEFVKMAPADQQAALQKQNEDTKKQFEMIPEAARDQACTQAHDALKQAKAAMNSAGK